MAASLIDPQEPGFDCRRVLDCARASALAYIAKEAPKVASDQARNWGLVEYEPLSAASHFAVVVGTPDCLIVAFRGTTEWDHWRTNLNIAWKKTPWHRVHRGFLEATSLFWPKLPDLIASVNRERRHLAITGHSLGAALAALTSARLHWGDNVDVSAVITFGQPAVGFRGFNSEFLRDLGPKYLRFVHDVDGVPGIPQLLYSHIGRPMYFDTADRLWNDKPFKQGFVDHVKAPGKYGGPEMFKTHGMRHYLGALDKFWGQTGVRTGSE